MKITIVPLLTILLGSCANFSYPLPQQKTDSNIPPLLLPQMGGPQPELSYQLAVPVDVISNLPKEKTVYRFVPKNVTESDFRSLANQLGMTGEPTRSTAERTSVQSLLSLRQGTKSLWVDVESGTWRFSDDRVSNSAEANYNLSDAEVGRIATQYLKSKKLLPSDFKFKAVTPITQQSGASSDAKVIGKRAFFYRYLDGQKVYGVSRIIVGVDSKGEIVNISKLFKDIEADSQQPLKSFDEAVAEVKAAKGMMTTAKSHLDKAIIENVKLRYYEEPGSPSEQPFLQPIYTFEVKGEVARKIERFEFIVPAIRNDRVGKPQAR